MPNKVVLLLLFFTASINAQQIRVACVGNSVTYGATIAERDLNAYPSRLQEKLGNTYLVSNFGHSGATLLKKGHKPFWDTPAFTASKSFLPNIVIIHLGLNDQGNNNWPKYKDEFIADYLELIQVYRDLPSKPRVIICYMSPSFSGHHWFEEGMRENYAEIQTKIEKVAALSDTEVLDLHEPLYRYPELYSDDLHPSKEGAEIIAEKASQYITGDYGGLRLPMLYGENMVVQRNEPIVFYGTANANDKVTINFHAENREEPVNNNGQWQVTFPSLLAGGPYTLTIKTKNSGSQTINKVYVGEVWLASGQSNMDFRVKDIKASNTVLKDSLNANIFLFSMDGNAQLSDHEFTKEELLSCNAGSYFSRSGWSNAPGEILENFSAVAYSFAYNLQKELNVPIGVICNAIGGSPIQSWISRESMETTHETISLLNDTHLNPMVQPWVSQRKAKNMSNKDSYAIKARHPFDPTFLFDAGILPLKDYTIKGVIWYQGESNAERVGLHSRLFNLLVEDWRSHWKKPSMPFNYVQLSSINRPTWGHFRDSQRRLLSVPNTGMAVSSDLGHPTDVHPKEKWVVGTRLAKVALAKNYHRDLLYSGPLLDYININKTKAEVHFTHAEGLKTTDGEAVKDIKIAGKNLIFFPAETRIKGDVLLVWSKDVQEPRYVKYGYSPYTNGNLINEKGWPASTFSNVDEWDDQ